MTIRSYHLVADKVAEADYFLARMEESASEFEVFRFNYSAFASAARSITFVLQTAMHDVPDFTEWYTERQARLKADPVARFFIEARNNVLKTGVNPITLGGSGGPGIESRVFWGVHPADALQGAIRGAGKGQDVRDMAQSYLVGLLGLVRDCFIDFRHFVDPSAIYTATGLEANSWTLEDVEESFGYPRGYVSALCKSDDERDHLLAFFRSSCDEVVLNKFLEKYGIERIPDLEDAA